jgi:hypothetical protein
MLCCVLVAITLQDTSADAMNTTDDDALPSGMFLAKLEAFRAMHMDGKLGKVSLDNTLTV